MTKCADCGHAKYLHVWANVNPSIQWCIQCIKDLDNPNKYKCEQWINPKDKPPLLFTLEYHIDAYHLTDTQRRVLSRWIGATNKRLVTNSRFKGWNIEVSKEESIETPERVNYDKPHYTDLLEKEEPTIE